MESGSFRKYDYGSELNSEKYSTAYPTPYDLKRIIVPISIFYGSFDRDVIVSVRDVKKLRDSLKNNHHVNIQRYAMNHNDFLFGTSVSKYVYGNILNDLQASGSRGIPK